jgi:hypothetical protein
MVKVVAGFWSLLPEMRVVRLPASDWSGISKTLNGSCPNSGQSQSKISVKESN